MVPRARLGGDVHRPRHPQAPGPGQGLGRGGAGRGDVGAGRKVCDGAVLAASGGAAGNERTLLPALVPLAPASTLLGRIPGAVGELLGAHQVGPGFVDAEVAAMAEGRFAKTSNRSVVGSMTDFAFLADVHRAHGGAEDLVALAVRLSVTPCGPLDRRHGSPDRALQALIAEHGRSEG